MLVVGRSSLTFILTLLIDNIMRIWGFWGSFRNFLFLLICYSVIWIFIFRDKLILISYWKISRIWLILNSFMNLLRIVIRMSNTDTFRWNLWLKYIFWIIHIKLSHVICILIVNLIKLIDYFFFCKFYWITFKFLVSLRFKIMLKVI